MSRSEDFLAGWKAARVHAQSSGSVPPVPPGYVATAVETPDPPSTPEPDPVVPDQTDEGTDEESE